MNCAACTPAPPEAESAGFAWALHASVSLSTRQNAAARPKRGSKGDSRVFPEIEMASFMNDDLLLMIKNSEE
jgi:hypothetical protein